MKYFLYVFMFFITYSFLGYLMEVVYCSIIDKKLVNRGFLIGPYCPIYGFGYLLVVSILMPYKNNPLLFMTMAMFVTSTLEYITSYIMEKLFKMKWWDYSHYKMNLNGRVCLLNSTLFGIASMIMVYLIDPVIKEFYDKIDINLIYKIAMPLFIIFIIDLILSIFIAKGVIKKINILEMLEEESRANTKKFKALNKRLITAFPDFIKRNTTLDIKKYIYEKEKKKKSNNKHI